jgi:hypothetical protein
MRLKEMVARYLELAGEFGKPVPLASFGLDRQEAERLFSALDEDYHISRFLHFSTASGAAPYTINGFQHSHISIDAEMQESL